MLILCRQRGQKIIVEDPLGNLLEIVVCGVRGNQVRVGVGAPGSFKIDREEIYKKRIAQKEEKDSLKLAV